MGRFSLAEQAATRAVPAFVDFLKAQCAAGSRPEVQADRSEAAGSTGAGDRPIIAAQIDDTIPANST